MHEISHLWCILRRNSANKISDCDKWESFGFDLRSNCASCASANALALSPVWNCPSQLPIAIASNRGCKIFFFHSHSHHDLEHQKSLSACLSLHIYSTQLTLGALKNFIAFVRTYHKLDCLVTEVCKTKPSSLDWFTPNKPLNKTSLDLDVVWPGETLHRHILMGATTKLPTSNLNFTYETGRSPDG